MLKLRAARNRKKARTGRCEGAKPYGYYPGEKRTLEHMRALRKQGLGYARIAGQLNAEGIPPRRGYKWHAYSVDLILSRRTRAT